MTARESAFLKWPKAGALVAGELCRSGPGVKSPPTPWPTPRVSDANTHSMVRVRGYLDDTAVTYQLREAVVAEEIRAGRELAKGSTINPDWMEWLMGFPLGWTDITRSPLCRCGKHALHGGDETRQIFPEWKMGSLFSGVGGFEVAGDSVDITPVWASEIDPFAVSVYEHRFPRVRQLGDVTKVDLTTLEPVDIICGGFPCFPAGTLVLTEVGYLPIEVIEVGTKVLTHTGRWCSVTKTMSKKNAPLVMVRPRGLPGFACTPEHPVFSRLGGVESWTNAVALTSNHQVAQCAPSDDKALKGSRAFWFLVGRYLADGWRVGRKSRATNRGTEFVNGSGRVVICCAPNEAAQLLTHITEAGFTATRVDEGAVIKFHITRSAFYRFLEPFGTYAHGKLVPGWVLGLDAARCRALFEGYFSGDGHVEDGAQCVTSVSRALLLGMALVAQKAYGKVCAIGRHRVPPRRVLLGRDVTQRDFYRLRLPITDRNKAEVSGRGWRPVSTVTSLPTRDTVYNLSVAEDESYIAEGVIVHNCQPVSRAGLEQAQNDPRWLWPAFCDVVAAVRPRYVLAENVPGLLSVNDGSAFADVIFGLAKLNYDVEWLSIPAGAVGAQHRRERIWIVGYPSVPRPPMQLNIWPIPNEPAWPDKIGWVFNPPTVVTPTLTVPESCPRVAPRVRTITTERIRCMGNAIVPEVALTVLARIRNFDKRRRAQEALHGLQASGGTSTVISNLTGLVPQYGSSAAQE